MEEITKYVEYMNEKFDIESEKTEGNNSENGMDKLINKYNSNNNKKLNTNAIQVILMEITRDIITNNRCYNVIDIERKRSLDKSNIVEIYEQYKKYKQNDKMSGVVPEIKMDMKLNTSDTYYIDTLSDITTELLIHKYGELVKTGDELTKHRYEYKFLLTYKNKKYIYCIYDYKKDGKFEKENDITWHIGCNIDKKEVTKVFIYNLKNELGLLECDCHE
jgi:hypothetical protein